MLPWVFIGDEAALPLMMYNSSSFDSTSATSHTFSSVSVGDAEATRKVHVFVSTTSPVSAVTVGGIAAMCNWNQSQGTVYAHIYTAEVPTGATADVVVTNSSASRCGVAVYTSYGLDSVPIRIASATGSSGSDPSFSRTVRVDSASVVGGTQTPSASTGITLSTSGTNALTTHANETNTASGHFITGYSINTVDESATDTFVTTTSLDSAMVAATFTTQRFDYSSASVMADFNGTNGATAFNEQSLAGAAFTFGGNAQLSTAQKKFGTASLLLDGTGDFVSLPNSGRFLFTRIGVNFNFTAEGFFRWSSDPAAFQTLMSVWNTTSQRSWGIFRDQPNGKLEFRISTTGSDSLNDISVTWAPTLNTWYHVAVDFDGTTYRLYVDGVMIGSSTTIRAFHSSTTTFRIGATGSSTLYFDGYIDSIRVINGYAAYADDAGFTPPSAEFETP